MCHWDDVENINEVWNGVKGWIFSDVLRKRVLLESTCEAFVSGCRRGEARRSFVVESGFLEKVTVLRRGFVLRKRGRVLSFA